VLVDPGSTLVEIGLRLSDSGPSTTVNGAANGGAVYVVTFRHVGPETA
jgi:hypothetical protein